MSTEAPIFDREFIADSLSIPTSTGSSFHRIWTDSRTAQPGDLFAAIPGEKFDGHDFVFELSEKGVKGAIVSRSDFKNRTNLPPDFWIIHVPDTTEALRSLAKAHRKRLSTKIIAVAGSNGKTTTKEWIAYLLRRLVAPEKVFKTAKSNNSILGIALTLLQIRKEDFAVIEIGIDEPGWMDKHLEVVQPNAGIITTIEEEHLAHLKNIETVAEEELKLLHFLRQSHGAFASNQDSPWIAKSQTPPETLSFSLQGSASIEGKYVPPNILSAFGLQWINPLAGAHNAQNLLAAIAVVRLVHPQITLEELRTLNQICPQFKGEAHRSLWLEFGRSVRVFDDCYNANPSSMEKALETFFEISKGCTQKLILGDMRDLGESTERAHMRILNLALVSEVDQIFLWGPEFSRAWQQSSKLPQLSEKLKISAHTQYEDLEQEVRSSIMPNDCFFLKGSRGMALERLLPTFESIAGKK